MGKHVSNTWFLVPIFFGLLGGIIAYAAVKDDDIEVAQGCLALGFVVTVFVFLLTLALL